MVQYVSDIFTSILVISVNMLQLTHGEKQCIVEQYFISFAFGINDKPSLSYVICKFTRHFNRRGPTKKIIQKIVNKFQNTGSIANRNKNCSGRPITVRTNANHGILLNSYNPPRKVPVVCQENLQYHVPVYRGL